MTRILRTKTILGGSLLDVDSRMFKIDVRILMASASWASSAVERRERRNRSWRQLSLPSAVSTEMCGHLASRGLLTGTLVEAVQSTASSPPGGQLPHTEQFQAAPGLA